MNDTSKTFRDQLLQMEMEQINPTYQEKYQKEVQEMLETKLTGVRKISFMVTGVFSTLVGLGLLALAITETKAPDVVRIGFLVGSLFAFVWVALMVRIFKRGTYNFRIDSNAITGWAWIMVVFQATLFMMVAPKLPGNNGVFMVMSGIVFLIMGLGFLVNNKIEQSEINTRMKLLEVELRLTEVMEALRKK